MNSLKLYLDKPYVKHMLFWIAVFLYFTLSSSISNYSGYRQLFETYLAIVGIQIITLYSSVYFFMPKFLNKKKTVSFVIGVLVLLIAMYAIYNCFRIYYLDPNYSYSYNESSKRYAQLPFLTRFMNLQVFMSKSIMFLTPTVLFLMLRFYKNQQKYLKLNEQKKIAELTALKNQLNPHFLFNTLNNLYALAVEKSDKTPEVIERLSDMLDYMLYRCNDPFVFLQKEIELIENYLALEKIRYGRRVDIRFTKVEPGNVKIAPLLLLTFIENAFKHGVSQELGKATITISIALEANKILFCIENTKPDTPLEQNHRSDEALGIKNVRQQLELLYSDSYDLQIDDTNKNYSVTLRLKQECTNA